MPTNRFFRRKILQASFAATMALAGRQSVWAVEAQSAWEGWRGPNRDGTCPNAALPTTLDSLELQWSQGLADSYSGPIVSAGMVFTTETVDKSDETLVAFNQTTGELVWKQRWSGAMSVPFFAQANGDWIRSTPVTDGRRIVVGGMCDVVACFEAQSGSELWRLDFVKDWGATLPSFGLVCSPLLDEGSVYIQAGGAVRKIRLEDGGLIWETLPDGGGMFGGAFSSPVIATLHGVRQLVVQTRTSLAGIELSSGRTLWSRDIASFRGMNILTPTVWNDRLFTSCYGGKAQLISLTPGIDSWQTEIVWESKAEAYMSSPVVIEDHAYLHLKNNRFCCIELATGAEKWRTTPFGKYWSMLTDGKSILALDEIGELLLIAANPNEFQLRERKKISDEPTWAHLALVGRQLFVRRQNGLDAYSFA